ncbi:YncE family protein [Candidatus Bipolaricaulota bacterium]
MATKGSRAIWLAVLMLLGLGLSAMADYVYVANPYIGDADLGSVVRMRSSDLAIVETIRVGNRAHSIVVSPDGDRVWVTCPGSPGDDGAIYVLGFTLAGSLEVRDIIDVGDVQPFGVAFAPDGANVYVAFKSTGQIAVFDATSYAYVTVDVGDDPVFVTVTPDGSKVYAIIEQDTRVVAIRASDRSVVADIDFDGVDFQDAVVSPDGTRLYVANRQMRRVEVIDTTTDSALSPITAPFSMSSVCQRWKASMTMRGPAGRSSGIRTSWPSRSWALTDGNLDTSLLRCNDQNQSSDARAQSTVAKLSGATGNWLVDPAVIASC